MQITFAVGDTDDVTCPEGYIQTNLDLNQGAGGKVIFLCFTYDSQLGQPIASLATVSGGAFISHSH
jgi:hypothetical protein